MAVWMKGGKRAVKAGQNLPDWQRLYFHFDTIPRRCLFGKVYHRVVMKAQMGDYHFIRKILPQHSLEFVEELERHE